MDELDLRGEIIRLKKRIISYKDENQMLKVKVRKLTTQLARKDREIEILMNPKQISNFRKVFSERSVGMLSSLREKNDCLQKELNDKNALIKKLQENLRIAKCYAIPEVYYRKNKAKTKVRSDKMKLILNIKDDDQYSKAQSTCDTPEDPQTLIEMLETARNSAKDDYMSRIKNCSPESDLERTELFYCKDVKHEEIRYLQDHFFELLTEVDLLKQTIARLQSENNQTQHVLERREDNIEKLTSAIEHLKLEKKKVPPRSNSSKASKRERQQVLKRIYSAGSVKQTKKNETKVTAKSLPRSYTSGKESKENKTVDEDEVEGTDNEVETY